LRRRFIQGLNGDADLAFGSIFTLVRERAPSLLTPSDCAQLLREMERNWKSTASLTDSLRQAATDRGVPDIQVVEELERGSALADDRAVAERLVAEPVRGMVRELLALAPFLTLQASCGRCWRA
jgi:hypothetical protein